MKLFILSMLATLTMGARLENTYLPPSSARTAGGSGHFLSTPNFGSPSPSSAFSTAFGGANTPSGAFQPSSGQYNARIYSSGQPQFRILKLDSDNPGNGNYRFEYETENQISQREAGEQRSIGNEQASNVHGSYSYTSPEGQHITVNYVADENGFRAQGDHIPTPPPVPVDIQQSLAINAASGGNFQGGPASSGAYDGIEISAARSANRQYLAPAIARANQQGYRY